MTLSRSHNKVRCHFCDRSVSTEQAVRGRGRNEEYYCSHSCVRKESEECNHSGVDIEYDGSGLMTAVCEYCCFPLRAEEIDTEYLKDSGEIIVTEWRAMP